MTKKVLAAASLVVAGLLAGCGSSSSPAATATAKVSGTVADGYLVNAVVFLDKNGNYQLDDGEPSAVTDGKGTYTLQIPQDEVGKFPIVALALKGQTTDLDNGQKVASSYLLSTPAAAVNTVGNSFVSPMSTLIREKMQANPGMSLSDAMSELRSQMNLPSGMNVMADYVSLGATGSTDANKALYQMMHDTAKGMVTLMADQAGQVMGSGGSGSSTGSTAVDVNRFRTMMGALNLQLPQMVAAMQGGVASNPNMMSTIAANVSSMVASVPKGGMTFRNMTSLFPGMMGLPFRNLTGHSAVSSLFPPMMGVRFWNMTGHPTVTVSRNMGGITIRMMGM